MNLMLLLLSLWNYYITTRAVERVFLKKFNCDSNTHFVSCIYSVSSHQRRADSLLLISLIAHLKGVTMFEFIN